MMIDAIAQCKLVILLLIRPVLCEYNYIIPYLFTL